MHLEKCSQFREPSDYGYLNLDGITHEILRSETNTRLKEDDFVNDADPNYSANQIAADKQKVKDREKKFLVSEGPKDEVERKRIENGKKRSEAFEVTVKWVLENSNWLGKNVKVVILTKYDDILNGFDLAIEIDANPPQRIALAIDVSMQTDTRKIIYKIKRNISKLTGKVEAPEIKYFQSKIDGFKGKLEVIPVVVGAEGNNANNLMALLSQLLKLKKYQKPNSPTNKIKEVQEEIEKHPIQIIFLKEIEIQLEMYLTLRSRIHGEEIENILTIIRKVIYSKKNIDAKNHEKDKVCQIIQKGADSETRYEYRLAA